jgi:predicted RNA-binding Zn-ribbon protein involved in translation (DUF1610 family)
LDDPDVKISIGYSLGGSIKYCPHCLGRLKIADSIGGWLIPPDYECSNCGYRGSVALEQKDSESIS